MKCVPIYLTGVIFLCHAFDASAALRCEPLDKSMVSDAQSFEDICERDDKDKRIEDLPDGTREVVVCSRDFWNTTGLEVEQGTRYRFTVIAQDNWNDWGRKADADGWIERSWFADRFGSWARRHNGANWFTLIAGIGRDANTFAAIGQGSTCVADSDGEIELFANDAWGFYWNNHGALKVRIETLDDRDDPGLARIE